MKYMFTNFLRWEQPLINAIRDRGYYVYGIRDVPEGNSIEERVIVNNIGFLVTDEKLTTPLFESELSSLGSEDQGLNEIIELIRSEIKDELEKLKEKCEKEDELFMKEFQKRLYGERK